MKRRSKVKSILHSIKKGQKEIHQKDSQISPMYFSKDIKQNEKMLKGIFGTNKDIIFRPFHIQFNDSNYLKALIVFTEGLADKDALRNNVLHPLIQNPIKLTQGGDKLQKVKDKISVFHTIENVLDIDKAVYQILKGTALLLIDGYNVGLLLKVAGYELRAIEEPDVERVVKGAHDGFIESSSTNISLIRRRIPHPSLKFETIKIGNYSQTDVTIAYIENIADQKLMKRIKSKINQIKLDSIHSSGEVEQIIEDHPYSIFPTIGNTERPDKAAAVLMEGRVLIIVDGDPVSLYAPYLFLENIHSVEDYSSRPYFTSFIRILRFFSFIISILTPGLYVAVINFHKVMIPSDLIVPLIQGRESVPFPLAMEIVIIMVMFEAVREAGVRLPEQFGSSLSIVGALIFGQVAVSAGIVSAPTTIFISIAYISSFINNSITDVTFLLRIGLFIAGSIFGVYGLIIAILGLITHMVSLTSIGIPYMAPAAPFYLRDWKDSLIRVPYRWMKKRPYSIPNKKSLKVESLPESRDK